MVEEIFKKPLHTPPHLFRANAIYFITGSTYQNQPYMASGQRKQQWLDAFRRASELYGWEIMAWVVLDNHYHVMARAPQTSAENLPKFIASYHKFTARQWNDEDRQKGRQIWWNYWDTCLRAEKDYLARLNYIYWNPVKHNLANRPEDYCFSSYRQVLDMTVGERDSFNPEIQVDFEDIPDDF